MFTPRASFSRHRERLALLLASATLYADLINPPVSEVTNQWQPVVLSPMGLDHQDNPTNEHNQPERASYRAKEWQVATHPFQGAEHAKEQERLHRMEAHKAAVPLQQEKDESAYPPEEIA